MDTRTKKFVHCTILSALCLGALAIPTHAQNAEIYIIETGTNAVPTAGYTIVDISNRLGEEIAFEIFVRQIGPNPLIPIRGVRADLPCIAEGGISGSVEYVQGSGSVFPFRSDFVFVQMPGSAIFDHSQCPDGNFISISVLNAGDYDITGLGPLYMGDFSLAVSADATGTFQVPLIGLSGIGELDNTPIPAFLRPLMLTERPCDFGPRLGDIAGGEGICGPDGEITLVDILAILNGFKGQFAEGCDLVNLDMAGIDGVCAPNGTVDLFDIFAVLDAFRGLDRCCPQ